MTNATHSQPLTDRLDRSTPAGRIAWHANEAASYTMRRLVDEAATSVEVAIAASQVRFAA